MIEIAFFLIFQVITSLSALSLTLYSALSRMNNHICHFKVKSRKYVSTSKDGVSLVAISNPTTDEIVFVTDPL